MGKRGKNWVLLRALRKVMTSETSTAQEIIDASTVYAKVQGILPSGRYVKNSAAPPPEPSGMNRLLAHVEEVKPS